MAGGLRRRSSPAAQVAGRHGTDVSSLWRAIGTLGGGLAGPRLFLRRGSVEAGVSQAAMAFTELHASQDTASAPTTPRPTPGEE